MLNITDSPRHAGIIIQGPEEDFSELYAACWHLLNLRDGMEDGECRENWMSLRMLSLCYDLRHAMPIFKSPSAPLSSAEQPTGQGKIFAFPGCTPADEPESTQDESEYEKQDEFEDEDFEDPDDDIDDDEILGDRLEVRILWPEAIFIGFMLNHYLGTYFLSPLRKKPRGLNQTVYWTVVRKFQLQIIDCLCASINPKKEKSIRALFHDEYNQPDDEYCTLYIERLTVDFVRRSPEKRVSEIGLIPARIANKSGDYYGLENSARELSLRDGVPPWEFHITDDYPEDVDW